MRLKLTVLFTVVVLFASCDYKSLHPAFWTIGKNKKEFKKVRDYYSAPEDSLKLRAAEYLIQNMKGHYYFVSKNEDGYDEFFRSVDSQISFPFEEGTHLYKYFKGELTKKAITKGFSDGSFKEPKYRIRSDLNTIKSELLIENIEYAFKAWRFPWAQNYSFDEFCRYILPYRYGNEPLESWRKTFFEEFKWVKDSVENPYNSIEVASLVQKQIKKVLTKTNPKGIKLSLLNQLDAKIFETCHTQNGFSIGILRSIGIPATLATCVIRGNKNSGHEMTAMLDSEKVWHIFDFGALGSKENRLFPKIFFKNFDNMEGHKLVLEDMSEKVMDVMDIKVEVNVKENDEIYLCVFGDREWFPLCKGENLKTEVLFENVGRVKNMYLAAIKSRGSLKPVTKAFSVDTYGNIFYYEPVDSESGSHFLTRKYPFFGKNKRRVNALIGGEFSVSDNRNFFNKMQLYKIDTILNYYNTIVKCTEQKGKYFRYDFPQSLNSSFDGPAEISFYTNIDGVLQKIDGEYFGSSQLSEEHIEIMTDNDILSYVEIWDCQEDLEIDTRKKVLRKDKQPVWIGMETDSAVSVTHVGICPRNDKNGIYKGMNYELFYWDDAWISLGEKVATGDSITFDNIPENAVLWLRNLDEGKEERIFTMKDGKQVWW